MSHLSGATQVAGQDIFVSSANQNTKLGALASTGDGRTYRYASVGAVAAVPGKLYQSAAEVTNHQNLAPTADGAVGDKAITVTLGATAATANQYAGGFVMITTSTGAGYMYEIASHPAADSAATLKLTLVDALLTTTASASTKVDLIPNPFSVIVVNPATATSAPVGAAVFTTGVGEYGFVQVSGPTNLLADGAVVVGTNVAASNATAGAVEAHTGVQALVGRALAGIATTQYGAIYLTLG
jgi:hypothetical protein